MCSSSLLDHRIALSSSFKTGRRVISTYLILFLHHASTRLPSSNSSHLVSPSSSQYDFDLINYHATHTTLIGERVGRAWDLPRSMLWTPPVSSAYANSSLSVEDRDGDTGFRRAPGMYKVQGTTVEGIMGGIYHQFVRSFKRLSYKSVAPVVFSSLLYLPFPNLHSFFFDIVIVLS